MEQGKILKARRVEGEQSVNLDEMKMHARPRCMQAGR